jgi:uncharacterized protein YodC (DUF2158 family)
MNQYSVGDVVQLKCGGPKMVVSRISDDGDLICTWFKGGDPTGGYFPPATVVPAD